VASLTVPVISGRTDTVTATIGVARFPQGVAVDPKANTIYVTNADDSTVSVISARTNTVTATIPVGTLAQPTGAAVDPKTGTAYVADTGISTGSVLAPCPK
jgi:YVTN family beta-propeller protein